MITGLDAVAYASTNARVLGLRSRLLSPGQWRDLLAAPDLATTLEVLAGTTYADVLAEARQTGEAVLERLERLMAGLAAANCRKCMATMRGAERDLVGVWWQQYELENLKALFRGFDQRMPPEQIARYLVPLGEHATLPWDALLHGHSVSSLVDRLAETHYGRPLRLALPRYQREGSLFALEVALDIRYYRDLAAAIRRLSGEARRDAEQVLGTRLDMLNILWAYRHRIYYGLSAEQIVNYTLWHTIRTDAALIRRIALGADPRDILGELWGGERGVDLSLLEGAASETALMPALEMALERLWWRLAERARHGYPFRLGAVLGYLVQQGIETRDVITVLEGKNLGWSRERITQHLVRSEV